MKYEFYDIGAKSIKELPPDSRPRERLATYGSKSLSDLELICILLGSGTKTHPVQAVAKELVKFLDDRNGKTCPTIEDLEKINGLGKAKASVISAALELGRRQNFITRKSIKTPSDVYPLISHYGDRDQEHLIVISLNGAHEVISTRVVSIGLLNRTLVHPREVFAPAIQERASCIIIAHNHPSGNLEPSRDDIDTTNKLVKASGILSIPILDHLIFDSSQFISLLELGKIKVVAD